MGWCTIISIKNIYYSYIWFFFIILEIFAANFYLQPHKIARKRVSNLLMCAHVFVLNRYECATHNLVALTCAFTARQRQAWSSKQNRNLNDTNGFAPSSKLSTYTWTLRLWRALTTAVAYSIYSSYIGLL